VSNEPDAGANRPGAYNPGAPPDLLP
jgi:hypothetical protein